MNKYDLQSKHFLEATETSCKITYVSTEINPLWDDNAYRRKYHVTLSNANGKMCFYFWDSIYNKEHGIAPREYDILACLEKYDVGTLEDFCDEFGYDPSERKVRKIYKACVKEYENLCRIFTEEQMEMLREIY